MTEADYVSNIHNGIKLRIDGDYDLAMALFVNLTITYPNNVMAFIEAGRTQYTARYFELAAAWFERAEAVYLLTPLVRISDGEDG